MFMKQTKKDYAGVKKMKYKTRIALMVGTSSSGGEVPLAVVGKPKNSECFKLMDSARPPLPYKNKANAWFDRKITLCWILNVFW